MNSNEKNAVEAVPAQTQKFEDLTFYHCEVGDESNTTHPFREQPDFRVIETYFDKINRQQTTFKFFAYGCTWYSQRKWVDVGYDCSHIEISLCEGTPNEKFIFEDIVIVRRCTERQQHPTLYHIEIYRNGYKVWQAKPQKNRTEFEKKDVLDCKTTAEFEAKIKKISGAAYFAEKKQQLIEIGLTEKEAIAYFRSKTKWKREKTLQKIELFRAYAHVPAYVFEALAQCNGKNSFCKERERWGIEYFDFGSFPRNVDAAQFIADMKAAL